MSDSIKQTTRQLAIKTGSLKRLSKEVSLYQKEYEEQKIVIEKLKDSNGDEWELKNAQKVLKDCHQMIKPSEERVQEAYEALKDLLEATSDDQEISSSVEYIEANKLLQETQLPTSSETE